MSVTPAGVTVACYIVL